ncbi:MAG: HD domain-containing protein [Ruminococcaceae bacterium]|nr:HD domain-containing protein [Oscillospiraceae bacterium]
MNAERLQKQLNFILEIDKEKTIVRQNHLTGMVRSENDAEHAWHMAIMIYLLREYANEEFDLAKAMIMALIHDIVEIDAGDTYAYDPEAGKTQKEREDKAARRIFGLLPEEQKEDLHALFNEFEEGKSPEARFARAMDNFQPFLLNNHNDGADWKAHNVRKSQVIRRQERSKAGSELIWDYTKKLIEENTKKGNLIDE